MDYFGLSAIPQPSFKCWNVGNAWNYRKLTNECDLLIAIGEV